MMMLVSICFKPLPICHSSFGTEGVRRFERRVSGMGGEDWVRIASTTTISTSCAWISHLPQQSQPRWLSLLVDEYGADAPLLEAGNARCAR